MRRKLLTAQDAFVGVRERQGTEEPQETGDSGQETGERQTTAEAVEAQALGRGADPEEGKEGWGAGDDAARGGGKARRPQRREAARQDEDEPPWTAKEERLMRSVVKDLTGALRVIRQQMEAKGPPERLTLYLEPEVAGELHALWQEVREATQLKVAKSGIVEAAVRMVLKDPRLKAAAAIMAVREKMGEKD